jgi:hypothetical protein
VVTPSINPGISSSSSSPLKLSSLPQYNNYDHNYNYNYTLSTNPKNPTDHHNNNKGNYNLKK